ncbi:hypothetical protein HUJ05_001920 [Dendroctonus ponderosae]|nr:hypothetical protein HUJ05_001920 [Dendroctonus ponderosae]
MKILRRITGKTLLHIETSTDVRTAWNVKTINEWVANRKKEWNEHISRMDHRRLVRIARNKSPLGRRDPQKLTELPSSEGGSCSSEFGDGRRWCHLPLKGHQFAGVETHATRQLVRFANAGLKPRGSMLVLDMQCPICLRNGLYEQLLAVGDAIRQINRNHPRAIVTFTCRLCQKRYLNKDAALCHVPKCKGPAQVGALGCANCSRTFVTARGLSTQERYAHLEARNIVTVRHEPRSSPPRCGRVQRRSVCSENDLAVILQCELQFQGDRNMAVRMHELLPHLTLKQFRDKRREAAYVRRRELLLAEQQQQAGLVQCTLEKRIMVERCIKCWSYEHSTANCNGSDRRGTCFICSKEGHVAKECKNKPQCPLCKKTGHKAGTGNCESFRRALSVSRQTLRRHTSVTSNKTQGHPLLASLTAMELAADIIVASEPNRKLMTENTKWIKDKRTDAAILLVNSKLRLEGVLAGNGVVGLKMQNFNIYGCYISPNVSIEQFNNYVDDLTRLVMAGNKEAIILGDFNSKAPEWGAPTCDARGQTLLEASATTGWVVINKGNNPTFIRGSSATHIDITFATQGISQKISDWMVLDNEPLPPHRQILIGIDTNTPRNRTISRFKNKIQIDGKKCADSFTTRILNDDIWGDAHKIVRKSFTNSGPIWQLTEQKTRDIITALFPRGPVSTLNRINLGEDDINPRDFTIEELNLAYHKIKTSKVPGPDGIPPEAIRAKLVLIHKAGRPVDLPSSYRPICLIDTIAKLYEHLLKIKLEEEVQQRGGLSPNQFGFTKGKSTLDTVRKVIQIANQARRNTLNHWRDEGWCCLVTLDVRNAFNSAPWSAINKSLEQFNVSKYLRSVMRNYLQNRYIITQDGEAVEVTAGIPQGSVLGPTLWNIFYNWTLEMEVPQGATMLGFADDIALVTSAKNKLSMIEVVNETLGHINNWISENQLELAPEKTEAILLSGKRDRKGISFKLGAQTINLSKSLKYLGITISENIRFGAHVQEAVRKAGVQLAMMTRLLPNITGPQSGKRALLYGVVQSVLLYGAPVWHQASYQWIQNREISAVAVQVLAGVPPIDLLIKERTNLDRTHERPLTTLTKKTIRNQTLQKWQERWDHNTQKGQWTRRLIPDLKKWVNCRHKKSCYHLTQAMTGHGCFKDYLWGIEKAGDNERWYCGEQDTVEHTLFVCHGWESIRSAATIVDAKSPRLIQDMIESPRKWKEGENIIKQILTEKEKDERDLQGQESMGVWGVLVRPQRGMGLVGRRLGKPASTRHSLRPTARTTGKPPPQVQQTGGSDKQILKPLKKKRIAHIYSGAYVNSDHNPVQKIMQKIEPSTIIEERWTEMKDEILKMVEGRRKHKTRSEVQYRALKKDIRGKCREAKQHWLAERCGEIELLQPKHDLHNVHKKIKEMTGSNRKKTSRILKDNNNIVLMGPDKKLKCWKEYVLKLFSDEQPAQHLQVGEINETSPGITKEEVKHAILVQKDGKAVGPDEVDAETLKHLIDVDGIGLSRLKDLFNDIYRTGKLLSEWLRYLGELMCDSCDSTEEVLSRIEQARRTFNHMKNFLFKRYLDLGLRIRMLRCYVFPILYGCASWTINPSLQKRIAAFEMDLYRTILHIALIERVRNTEVLNRIQKNKELMLTIKERKLRYIGHIVRSDEDEILRLIIEEQIQGKGTIGRRKNSCLKDLR